MKTKIKKLFIIVGHTGAGKTTLCQRLGKEYCVKVIPFSMTAKQFAESKGYSDENDVILKCYEILGSRDFSTLYKQYMLELLENSVEDNDVVIVEGLYISNIISELRKRYKVCIVAIDVPRSTGIARKTRCNKQMESMERYKSKEKLKEGLGIKMLMQEADYHIDGTNDRNKVFQDTSAIFESFR